MDLRRGLTLTPVLPLVLALVCGLLLAYGLLWIGVGVGLCLVASCCWLDWGRRLLYCLILLGAYGVHEGEVATLHETQAAFASFEHTSVPIDVPRARVMKVEQRQFGYRSHLKVLGEEAKLRGTSVRIPAGAILMAHSGSLLNPGAIISLHGQVPPKITYGNWAERDYSAFRRRRGIAGAIQIEQVEQVSWHPLSQWMIECQQNVRDAMLCNLRAGLSPEQPAYDILPALILGIRPVEYKWMEPYRQAGVMHMFVVSGMHVGMVFTALWAVLYLTPLRPIQVTGICLVLVWVYAWVTGLQPPVVRTVLALTVYLLAWFLRRRTSAINSVLVALVLILCLNRFVLYETGVWLSFGVVFALIFCVNRLVLILERSYKPDPYLPKELWSASQRLRVGGLKWSSGFVIVTLVAWVTSSLITAVSIGVIYPYGVFSSLILLPLAFGMMLLGGAAICLGALCHPMAVEINTLNNALASHASNYVQWVNRGQQPTISMQSYGYRDSLTVFNLPKSNACLCLGTSAPVLIDTGSEFIGATQVAPTLRQAGISPSQIYLSHADVGHQGAAMLYPKAAIHTAYTGEVLRHTYDGWLLESMPVKVPDSLRSDDSVALIRLTKGGHKIGYIADAGLSVYEEMKARNLPFQCDLLICGHNAHGEGALLDFLNYTGAKSVILGQPYFYAPAPVIDGVELYYQPDCGAVRIRAGGEILEVETYR